METPPIGIPERSKKPKRPEEEVQKANYFGRFGLRLLSKFKILSDPLFKEIWKQEARKQGWFTGNHSIVEAALALKVAELLKLSPEEREILLTAAMTHHAYKRIQYENPEGKKDWTESRLEGNKILKAHGISDEVLAVIEITDPKFFREVDAGAVPSLLQQILAFTHEATHTKRKKSEEEPPTFSQKTTISWGGTSCRCTSGKPGFRGKIFSNRKKNKR